MITPTKQSPNNLYRVIRGGSWLNSSTLLVLGAYCIGNSPLARSDNIGFRCSQRGVRMTINDKDRP